MSSVPLHPHETLAFLKASRRSNHQGRSLFDRLYSLYLGAFVFCLIGVLAYTALRDRPFTPEAATDAIEKLPFILASLFCLAVIAALRFATWQGPVSFSRPDVPFLLSSPLSRSELVRPKLVGGLTFGAAAGFLGGMAAFVFLQAKLFE